MTSAIPYESSTTALLCVDFYNDFLSEGGKLWPWVKEIAEEVSLLDNLRTIVRTAREVGITIYHVPHHRWEPGDYVTGRIGMELGYHVTLVRDATAARSPEAMHAALNIDGPTYAHAILTTAELVAALKNPR